MWCKHLRGPPPKCLWLKHLELGTYPALLVAVVLSLGLIVVSEIVAAVAATGEAKPVIGLLLGRLMSEAVRGILRVER